MLHLVNLKGPSFSALANEKTNINFKLFLKSAPYPKYSASHNGREKGSRRGRQVQSVFPEEERTYPSSTVAALVPISLWELDCHFCNPIPGYFLITIDQRKSVHGRFGRQKARSHLQIRQLQMWKRCTGPGNPWTALDHTAHPAVSACLVHGLLSQKQKPFWRCLPALPGRQPLSRI